ncbi:hypothetical protein N7E81_16360 [Reichenbachiella carrageenanivorans]|uniref:Uncharacterized protein n=1 Tax=Reichenbachiella carrageenanivorans TaxID=2979869 RepID=A0ABY6CYD6_9BACT|nr:hypothetical protein [Reichenbachiella carrageenanivorans]UXX78929.1 hypothetical protein N7E81_16360 [Reichenbachiella carrageenanivorans]
MQLEEDGFSFSFAEAPFSISSNLKECDFKIIYEKQTYYHPVSVKSFFSISMKGCLMLKFWM